MWLGEVSPPQVLLTFLGTGELGSSQGASLTSSAQQMVAAGQLEQVSQDQGQMSLAPAGWPVGLLSDMLWSSVSHPPLSKKSPPFAFFLKSI